MAHNGGGTGRDVFALTKGVDFVAYTETFLGVVFTDLRAPKCLCPFHEDKNPSFSVSVRLNKGKCFVCQEKMVDVVDFTAKVCGISSLDAAKKIVEDLGL